MCSKITDNDYKLLNTIAISVNICFPVLSVAPVIMIMVIKWTDKKFKSMYSKLTEGIELLRNSVRDNYNSMQENVSTFLTKVKDLYMCSQNVDLQEKFNHLRVLYTAIEHGDTVQVRSQFNIDSATKIRG